MSPDVSIGWPLARKTRGRGIHGSSKAFVLRLVRARLRKPHGGLRKAVGQSQERRNASGGNGMGKKRASFCNGKELN